MIAVGSKNGGSEATVTLQDTPLRALVDKIAGEVDQPERDARLDWNGGNIKVLTPGQDGRKVDREKALALLTEAISGDQRTVALPVDVEEAIGDSIDPSTLGIKERIEFGQTTIAGVPEKVHNIKLAASRLNGVVLRPGEVFSFNNELGPTTLKSGYQIGFGISVENGEMQTVPSVAGGICQVATTLLHAVFWAGYQIEERYPHLYWIPNYGKPPKGMTGLDATVDAPNLDFKFSNNTGNYLLIQTKTDNNVLEFDLYGTKPNWKVDVQGPIITNVVKADTKTVRQEEPTWDVGRELWVESATDGMDVDIIRTVTQGSDVRTLHLKSHYQPAQNVLMVGTKKPEAPSPSATPAPGQQPAPSSTPAPAPAKPAATPAPAASPTTARQ
jgi:vancomycin resistance protein YoaR